MPLFQYHIDGSKAGQVDAFDTDQIRIGRQRDNDLNFAPQLDRSVSGHHTEIYRDGDTDFLKNLQRWNYPKLHAPTSN